METSNWATFTPEDAKRLILITFEQFAAVLRRLRRLAGHTQTVEAETIRRINLLFPSFQLATGSRGVDTINALYIQLSEVYADRLIEIFHTCRELARLCNLSVRHDLPENFYFRLVVADMLGSGRHYEIIVKGNSAVAFAVNNRRNALNNESIKVQDQIHRGESIIDQLGRDIRRRNRRINFIEAGEFLRNVALVVNAAIEFKFFNAQPLAELIADIFKQNGDFLSRSTSSGLLIDNAEARDMIRQLEYVNSNLRNLLQEINSEKEHCMNIC